MLHDFWGAEDTYKPIAKCLTYLWDMTFGGLTYPYPTINVTLYTLCTLVNKYWTRPERSGTYEQVERAVTTEHHSTNLAFSFPWPASLQKHCPALTTFTQRISPPTT